MLLNIFISNKQLFLLYIKKNAALVSIRLLLKNNNNKNSYQPQTF